jgi:hypothetical protein
MRRLVIALIALGVCILGQLLVLPVESPLTTCDQEMGTSRSPHLLREDREKFPDSLVPRFRR